MSLRPVADLASFTGSCLLASVEGKQILLVRVGERVYATDAVCPHRGNRLAAGRVRGAVIECPGHRRRFDVRTGRMPRHWWSRRPAPEQDLRLRTYRAIVTDGQVFVDAAEVLASAPNEEC